ncbi:Restriction endonuclease [Prosthecobacter debontii]|uniref:Restriction endonuclease n=1 Tax=Prosthecobacter debontii TaxID=48467 RepID=A0A1T4XL20_9BACT|nr:restriction endonuclease [Prosthecobacter debontii]SKA90289.1 Restriction endonuclease [Prosthecobacter debontii]
MNKKLSLAFVELTQNALFKAIWFKGSLRMFLIQHQISETALAQWQADQSKREFIEWLWPRQVKDEKGQNAILGMARSLAEMNPFPDLERKEDTKERIPEAAEAINRLRRAVSEINETIRETRASEARRKAAIEEVAKRQAAQQSLEKLQTALNNLTSKIGTQESGYEFERWSYDLAIYFELEARPGYKATGRQIDGAITIEGTTFLIETKLVNEPIGSPNIDIFMAKIESKADNTMGLFISQSCFNEGAKLAASKQRTPMLLLDSGHVFNLIMRGEMTPPQVVSRIKRHAHQTGSSYLDASDF